MKNFGANETDDEEYEFVWKRAKDLADDPHFAINDTTMESFESNDLIGPHNYQNYFQVTDLDQGCLGDCWFISAAAGITKNYNLFKRVVPFDNSFRNDVYTG